MKTSNKLFIGFLACIVLLIAVILTTASRQINREQLKGNGITKTKQVAVQHIQSLTIKGRFTVVLAQGDSAQITISTAENLLDNVLVEENNGEVEITLKNKISKHDKIKLHITADALTALSLAAGTKLDATAAIKADKFSLSSTSGSVVNISFDINELTCETSSGAMLTLNGKANNTKLEYSSGAMFHADDLVCKTYTVEGSSGGMAEINVLEELEAEVSSGGMLKYSGKPKMKKLDSSSGGSIQSND